MLVVSFCYIHIKYDFWDADACNLHLETLVMQKVLNHEKCVMLMTFFPIFVILILICFFFLLFFFLWKTQIDCLFFKDVITHETLSYLFANLFGDSLRVYALFDHLKIL